MKKCLFSFWVLAGCGVPAAAEYYPPVPMAAIEVLVPVVVSEAPKRGVPVQVETTTTIPAPRVWDGVIPEFYGAGTGCSRDEASVVARRLWDAGGSDDTVVWMLGVMSRESACDSSAHNGNRRTGDDSWGLCQINTLAGWFDPDGLLADVDRYRFATDFALNVEACIRLWEECGRGPWNYSNYYCRSEL